MSVAHKLQEQHKHFSEKLENIFVSHNTIFPSGSFVCFWRKHIRIGESADKGDRYTRRKGEQRQVGKNWRLIEKTKNLEHLTLTSAHARKSKIPQLCYR